MEQILGLTPTGRELRDPVARLVEATDDEGRHYTVIVFDEGHVGHPSLTLNVNMVLSFMEYPMVTGLVELGRHDVEKGLFAYPTGSVWTLSDVMRAFSDFGQVVGLRAGLELAWLAAQVLVEAGDTGPVQGCFSHGNLNPWRVALRADGMVQVLGYGLPQVEMIRHRSEEGPPLDAASYYYCPPERLEGVPEDAAADTYALTLLVYELIRGEPLYATHDTARLERMVGMSEGATLLSRSDAGLPPKVAKLFARALVYDPDTRLSGRAYVEAIGHLLANEVLEGPSLSEVVETLKGRQSKGQMSARRLVSAQATSVFTPEQLAAAAAEEDDDDAPSEGGDAPRWAKVERPRRANPAEPEPEIKRPEDGRRLRRAEAEPAAASPRRRRRGTPDDVGVTGVVAQDAAPTEPTPAPAQRRARRPAPDAEPDAEAAAPQAEPSAPEPSVEPEAARRRVRMPPVAETPADLEEAEGPSPRRRRGPVDDDDDDDAPRRRRR